MRVVKMLACTLLVGLPLVAGCQDKYERLPAATETEVQALKERYQALVEAAKKLKEQDRLRLLHHFSQAALTMTSPADFNAKADKFIAAAASGKLDGVEIRGARAPGKVRLLLVTVSGQKRVIPFVQTADGWKFDDVDLAFGDTEKEPNLQGNMPVSPPSVPAAIMVLQDVQASEVDKVQAALQLGETGNGDIAQKYAAKEKSPWPRAALLHAAWKNGGECEPFADAFPVEGQQQTKMYENDSDSFRALLLGLFECAFASNSFAPTLKIYQGCYQVEGGARSEYVDPLVGNPNQEKEFLKVGLANQKPEFLLRAALQSGYKYEEDPVANIVVGALHGEKGASFYQYLHQKARGSGRIGNLAKAWAEKMAGRDETEPSD